jgi:tetratricopeptide (TPR) repeat protein
MTLTPALFEAPLVAKSTRLSTFHLIRLIGLTLASLYFAIEIGHADQAGEPPAGFDELGAARAQCLHGQNAQARRDACSAVLSAPGISPRQMALSYYQRAVASHDLKQDDKAFTDLDAALRITPDLEPALSMRADLRSGGRDYLGAAADYAVLVKYHPASDIFHDLQGVALDNGGEHDAAIAEFGKAISLAKDVRARAHYFVDRGAAYQFEHHWDAARADYGSALTILPGLADALMGRARIAYLLKDYDSAIADLGAAVDRDAGREQLYEAIWLQLAAMAKGGVALQAVQPKIAAIDAAYWPGPILKVLRGELKQSAVTLPTDDPIFGVKGPSCEFDFYMAQLALIQGERAKAIDLLHQAVATDVKEYVEHTAAVAQLDMLKN